METTIFDAFKYRLLHGEVEESTNLNITLVNDNFPKLFEYSGMSIEQYRTQEDFDNLYKYRIQVCDSAYSELLTDSSYSAIYDSYKSDYETDYENNDWISTKPHLSSESEYAYYYTHSALNEISSYKTNIELHDLTYFRSEEESASVPMFVYSGNSGDMINNVFTALQTNENISNYIENYSGFYAIRNDDELEWFANKVNADTDYNNEIVGVFVQSIYENDTRKDDVSIGTIDHHFNGILDGNGLTFKNLRITTNESIAGLVGVLGTKGVVRNFNISGMYIDNTKRINIEHLTEESTDCFHAGLVGINYGGIENIKFIGDFKPNGYIPSTYLMGNKTETQDEYCIWDLNQDNDYEVNKNLPGYSNGYCSNNVSNCVPYAGYFAEYVYVWPFEINIDSDYRSMQFRFFTDATYVKMLWNDTVVHINKKTLPENGFTDPNSFPDVGMLVKYNKEVHNYGYFLESNFRNKNGSDSTDIDDKILLNYDLVNTTDYNSDINDDSEDDDNENWLAKIVNAKTFHKRMHSYLRNAFYISPICGLNNGVIRNVKAKVNIIQSDDTFVGFIGGLAGKNAYGMIQNSTICCSYNENSAHEDSYKEYDLDSVFKPSDRYNTISTNTDTTIVENYINSTNPINKMAKSLSSELFKIDNTIYDYNDYLIDYTRDSANDSQIDKNFIIGRVTINNGSTNQNSIDLISGSDTALFSLSNYALNNESGYYYSVPYVYYDDSYSENSALNANISISQPFSGTSSDSNYTNTDIVVNDAIANIDLDTNTVLLNFNKVSMSNYEVNNTQLNYQPVIYYNDNYYSVFSISVKYTELSNSIMDTITKSSMIPLQNAESIILETNDENLTFSPTTDKKYIKVSFYSIASGDSATVAKLTTKSYFETNVLSYDTNISNSEQSLNFENNISNMIVDSGVEIATDWRFEKLDQSKKATVKYKMPSIYNIGVICGQFNIVPLVYSQLINIDAYNDIRLSDFTLDDDKDSVNTYYGPLNRVGTLAAIADCRASDVSLYSYNSTDRNGIFPLVSGVNLYLVNPDTTGAYDHTKALTAAIVPEIDFSPFIAPGVISYGRANANREDFFGSRCYDDVPLLPFVLENWSDADRFGGEKMNSTNLIPAANGIFSSGSNYKIYTNLNNTRSYVDYYFSNTVSSNDVYEYNSHSGTDYTLNHNGHIQSKLKGISNLGSATEINASSFLSYSENFKCESTLTNAKVISINQNNITYSSFSMPNDNLFYNVTNYTIASQIYDYNIEDTYTTASTFTAYMNYDSASNSFKFKSDLNPTYLYKDQIYVNNTTFSIGNDPTSEYIKAYFADQNNDKSISFNIPIMDNLIGVLFQDSNGNNIEYMDLNETYTDYSGNFILQFNKDGKMIDLN